MNTEFLTQADMITKVFWGCAIFGTVIFGIKTVMMLLGMGFDGDADLDVHADGDSHFHGDGADSFHLLSIQSITAFIMMFGWAGLTSYIQFGLSSMVSSLIAFCAGFVSMLIIAFLFKMSKGLVSQGETFDINNLVGKTANVYQKIPAEGKGRVTVHFNDKSPREIDAVSADKVEIESFKTVKIISVIDHQTVSVKE